MSSSPNILFIVADQHNEVLGHKGHPDVRTIWRWRARDHYNPIPRPLRGRGALLPGFESDPEFSLFRCLAAHRPRPLISRMVEIYQAVYDAQFGG